MKGRSLRSSRNPSRESQLQSSPYKMRLSISAVALMLILGLFGGAYGIRFVIDMEECFSHKVEYGNTVHFSFVVIKSEGSWHYSEDGVNLVVKGPNG
ncbi:hypothetical protein ACS0TY_029631 [Phlomoides rotata]